MPLYRDEQSTHIPGPASRKPEVPPHLHFPGHFLYVDCLVPAGKVDRFTLPTKDSARDWSDVSRRVTYDRGTWACLADERVAEAPVRHDWTAKIPAGPTALWTEFLCFEPILPRKNGVRVKPQPSQGKVAPLSSSPKGDATPSTDVPSPSPRDAVPASRGRSRSRERSVRERSRSPSTCIRRWLADTGCGFDLVQYADVSDISSNVRPVRDGLTLSRRMGRRKSSTRSRSLWTPLARRSLHRFCRTRRRFSP